MRSAILTVACLIPALAADSNRIDFNRDIRPILSDTCFTCHGPDEKPRQAELRLDTKEGAFAARKDYAIIVPGDAAKSRLYQRISAEHKAMRMPPPYSNRSLTDKQIELIRQWIDQGARWETHWAFVAPQRPALPEVQDQTWPGNAVDRFILARLEREGLKPSPEADKVTLLRRLSFDLTGLPPAPEEVDAFLADKSRDAYEKQAERLLGSPRYGERMAMEWLDLARYADTHGYHIDSHREMWHWRDWIIRAFNRNMPFDQFTIEQLAGDRLPHPTMDQRIATGFNRNHMINFEGGAIPEEYLNEYVADRVETTSTVWMGLTLTCARCHDHKYDPVKQKEFYQLYAFFNDVPEKGLDGRRGNAEPVLPLVSPEQRRRLQELNEKICQIETALPESDIEALQADWEKTRAATLPADPREGLVAHYELDGNLADVSGHYRHARTPRGEVVYSAGYAGRAGEFTGETHVDFGHYEEIARARSFSIAVWVRYSGTKEMAVLHKMSPSEDRRGFEMRFDDSVHVGDLKRGANLYVRLVDRWPESSIQIKTRKRLVQGDWYHVTLSYDASGKAAGLKLYLNGKLHDAEVLQDNLAGEFATSEPLGLGDKRLALPYKGRLDDLRVYRRLLAPAEIETLAIHHPVGRMLNEAARRRSKEERERLREYFLKYDAPERVRSRYAELKVLRKKKEELEKTLATTMVMAALEAPRKTHVLGRGDYRNKGEQVTAGVPEVLPPLPENAPLNRLGLAKWLVDPAHPLTARVAVNRFWQMFFGTGIVKTSEDFGSQGEQPSHPELLDWLATEFIRTGWDVKAIQRLIVTSATYRQSSQVTPELVEKDPENRLLARGPRFSLPAEMVRDSALYSSGLLNEEMGGPGVFPYQPQGVWEDIAYGDVYSAQAYEQSSGKDLYRRSLYIFWKRTAPPPSLMIFDAPDREKCIARRPRTNTPLQALVLMNDPTYVEAARALARRMITEAGRSSERRIRHGFRLATARRPAAKEIRVLRNIAARKLSDYRRDKNAALDLLRVGESKFDEKLDPAELAAWTTVASVILSLDETITKE